MGHSMNMLEKKKIFGFTCKSYGSMLRKVITLSALAFGLAIFSLLTPDSSLAEECVPAANPDELSQRLLQGLHSGYRYMSDRITVIKECINTIELAEEFALLEIAYGGLPAISKALEQGPDSVSKTQSEVLLNLQRVHIQIKERIKELSNRPTEDSLLNDPWVSGVVVRILEKYVEGGVATTQSAKTVLNEIMAMKVGSDAEPSLYAEGSGYEQFVRRYGVADLSIDIATLDEVEKVRQDTVTEFPADKEAILNENYVKQMQASRNVLLALGNEFAFLTQKLKKPAIIQNREGKWVGDLDWDNPIRVQSPDGTPIAVWEYDGDKPLIVVVGGWPTTPGTMDVVARIFHSMGHRVIQFAQRGVYPFPGAPNSLNHALDNYVEDIEAIRKWAFREKDGVGKMHLFGHSWGGVYVQLYAKKYRDQLLSLFMSCPATGVGKDWIDMYAAFGITFRPAYGVFNYPIGRLWWNIRFLKHIAKGEFGRRVTREHAKYAYPTYSFDPNQAPNVPLNSRRAPPGADLAKLDAVIKETNKNFLDEAGFEVLKNSIPVVITFGRRDIYNFDLQERVRNRFALDSYHIFEKSGHSPWRENRRAFQTFAESFYK